MSACSLNHAPRAPLTGHVTGARLIGISDAVRGVLVHLTERWYRIGSAPCEDLSLYDPDVAARQCVLVRRNDGSYEIADLDSGKPTRVNGRSVHEAILQNGDTVQIGHHEFGYLTDEKPVAGHIPGPASEQPAPPVPALSPPPSTPASLPESRGQPQSSEPPPAEPDVPWNMLLGLGATSLLGLILLFWLLLG